MNIRLFGQMIAVALLIGLATANGLAAPSPEPGELQPKDAQVKGTPGGRPPFSFVYDGTPSA